MHINGRTHELLLRYVPGDEAWADRVATLVPQAIPVLEQIIGAPYPGPPVLRVSEKGGEAIFGAAGVAACNENMCGLAVTPFFSDQTLLHEMAHVWTQAFKNRWLSEGTAEYASYEAARLLGFPITDAPSSDNSLPSYPLDEWGRPVDFLTAEEEVLLREYEGYDRSTRLLEVFEQISPGAFRAAYSILVPAPPDTVDSERFMDALEDAGGDNLDDLFRTWVFPPEMDSQLAERRAARNRLAGVSARLSTETPELGVDALTPAKQFIDAWRFSDAKAAIAGLNAGIDAYLGIREPLAVVSGRLAAETPELGPEALAPIRQLVAEWKFAEAETAIAAANAGIDSYLQVRDRLLALRAATEEASLEYPAPYEQAQLTLDFGPITTSIEQAEAAALAYSEAGVLALRPRSLWVEAGLFGEDPDGKLRAAARYFRQARFEDSMRVSRDAEATLAGAEARGARNLALAAGFIAAALVGGYFAFRWALRGDAEPAGSSA